MTAVAVSPAVAACEAVALRALEYAGNRMRPRSVRSELAELPAHLTHTRVRVGPDDCARLLGRSLTLVDTLAELHGFDPDRVRDVLADFLCELLQGGQPYTEVSRAVLADRLGVL